MSTTLRVLIVEDSEDDATLLLRELRRGDYEVIYQRVDTPDRMNEVMETDAWDIVICDYSMPHFSGIDALRMQRSKDADVPFIFLSGTIGEEAAIAALKEGAHDCLMKSDLKRLIPTVRRELRDAEQRKARKRLELEVQDLQRFASIAKLTGGIAHELNSALAELLATISTSVREVVPHDCVTLALHDSFSGTMRILFVEADEFPKSLPLRTLTKLSTTDLPPSKTPVLLDRFDAVPFTGEESVQHLSEKQMRSGCMVPLIDGEQSIGSLIFASAEKDAFGQKEIGALSLIASQIATVINNSLAFRQIADLRDRFRLEKQYLEEEMNLEHHFDEIVGSSQSLKQVLKQIETVAPTDATVLIQGETGTGKELLARAIHKLSPRRDRTFIKLNCAAIPAGLLESELFGHEKGAFTGAVTRKMGRLELANEGTLFLDEIGELHLELQPKLLRAIQEREFERIGGTRPISVNVRMIAATNRDLATMVAEKQFRADLFYRLKVFPIFSPPLRERVSDIPVLVRHFVSTHSRRMGKVIESIPEETMEALQRWKWPGNIRELENFLERAVILTRGRVLYVPLAELENELNDEPSEEESPSLLAAERDLILRVLRETKGQIGGPDGAAARLGLKRTTLNSKMKKLKIQRRDDYLGQ
jgi:transcriptional regulator with GAF, ATPase, and Fis domain